jgi:tight adherence protein B
MLSFFLVLLVVWGVVAGAWLMLGSAFNKADSDKLRERVVGVVRQKSAKSASKANQTLIRGEDLSTGALLSGLLRRFQLHERLAVLLEQAGLKWKVGRLVHTCLGLFLAGFAVGWLFLPSMYQTFALIPGFAAGALPMMYVLQQKKARLRKFEEQFPESLEFVARSMRAGHAFSVSLEMLHREFQEPLAGEYRRVFEEHNLGLPLDTALQKMGQRIPSLDVHFFVSAVLLQKRTGGNLAEILDKLAYVIRERFKLRGKIRAISAHGRITGMALTSIPIAVAGMMFIVNPTYVTFFATDEVGNIMAGAGVLLQIIGYLIIKKIVAIEV